MLLVTHMRYGKISYEGKDVVFWDPRWKPSEKAVRDLGRQWRSARVVKVQFIANDDGGVDCHVVKVKKKLCSRLRDCMSSCALGCFICLKLCVVGMYNCTRRILAWCFSCNRR